MSSIDSKFLRLLVYISITLVSGFVFSALSMFVVGALSDNSLGEITTALNNLEGDRNITLTKVFLFLNSFGLFVLPPILFTFVFKLSFSGFFRLKERRTIALLPILILLFVFLVPVLNFTVEWNKLLELPGWLNELETWMRQAEDSAAVKTKALLQMTTYTDLVVNIFLIGVLPAVGEELAFRGVVQQTLIGKNSNPHWGIWGAAFIFSFIHFQFFGFLPRLLLGAFFGYLFYWSKSLWLPILGHFINNTSAILIAFYLSGSGMDKEFDKVGATEDTGYITVFSFALFAGLLYYFKKQSNKLLR